MNFRILLAAAMAAVCLGASPSSSTTTTTTTAPPPKKTYVLAYRPAVGHRVAFEQVFDLDMHADAMNTAKMSAHKSEKRRRRLSVSSSEITAIRGDGVVAAKRVSFGENTWTTKQLDDKSAEEKRRLFFAGKTVNYAVTDEGEVEQDFGVKPPPEIMRLVRHDIEGHARLFPKKPVAVGERWRADKGLGRLLDLRDEDQLSGILTLKAVREENGREVADIGLSAGMISKQFGFHAETSLEGTLVIDLKIGVLLKTDLIGQMNISGGGSNYNVIGGGRVEVHEVAKLLALGRPSTQPSSRPTPSFTLIEE